MSERISGLKFFSLGIVTETKPVGTDMIKVNPIEQLSLVEGPINDAKINYSVALPDHKGIKRQESVDGEMVLVAQWLPFGHSNRMTSPDVVASETVIIFRMADTPKYYWTTIFREPGLRRLETVNYAWSNKPTGVNDPFDKDSSYWLEVSTRDKYIHLHTANNDGEPFKYDILINTKDGSITITDDVGNNIVLDSAANKLTVNTNEDIEFNTKRIKFNASESIEYNTPKYTLNASDSATVNTTTNTLNATDDTQNTTSTTVNAGSSIALSTAQLSMDASSMTSTSGQMNMQADSVQLAGNGNTVISGPNIQVQGGDIILTGGAITANGEDLTVDKT